MGLLSCVPIDKSSWPDLEKLFESRGGPHYCWCMVWRNMEKGKDRSKKVDKKNSLQRYVDKGLPIGLLCYQNSEPIAWCSIAPRDSYRELHGDNSLIDVWSLVCFFVKREFRKMGVMEKLITEAEKYAAKNGAKYIEAYPVEKDAPSYRFMGLKPTFEKLGFEFKHQTGKWRKVMTRQL